MKFKQFMIFSKKLLVLPTTENTVYREIAHPGGGIID